MIEEVISEKSDDELDIVRRKEFTSDFKLDRGLRMTTHTIVKVYRVVEEEQKELEAEEPPVNFEG